SDRVLVSRSDGLRFLVAEEPLPRERAGLPGMERECLRKLPVGAAVRGDGADLSRPAGQAPRRRIARPDLVDEPPAGRRDRPNARTDRHPIRGIGPPPDTGATGG